MKILVISDTHRSCANLNQVLEKEEGIDAMIHAGDIEGKENQMFYAIHGPVYMVAGNNDFFSSLPEEVEGEIAGHRFFLTHGHRYYVSVGEERIEREGRKRGAELVIYGHTHRISVDKRDGIWILNPGSLSYPRQANRKPSYIILWLEQGEEPRIEMKYL